VENFIVCVVVFPFVIWPMVWSLHTYDIDILYKEVTVSKYKVLNCFIIIL